MTIPFRFLHGADLHIDSPFKGLKSVPQKVKESLLEATFLAFERMVSLAIREQVSFIVISGDLFDESDRSLKAQLFLLQQYERLKEHHIAIFIIHGNHDHMGGNRVPFPYPENVHVFGSNQVTTMPAHNATGELVAYVHGISYPTRHVYENLSQLFEPAMDDCYHIGMYHGSVGSHHAHDPYAACQVSDLLEHNYQYWALGHIHKQQLLYEKPVVAYAGNAQGRHRNEAGDKGCLLITVDELGNTSSQFQSLAFVRWEHVIVNINEIHNEAQLISVVQRELTSLASVIQHAHRLVSMTFVGSGYIHDLLQQAEVKEQLLEHFGSWYEQDEGEYWTYVYELIDNSVASYDEAQLLQEDSFASDMIRSYEELVADSEQLELLYEQALEGLRLQPSISKWLRKLEKPDNEQLIHLFAEAKQHALEQMISKQRQGAGEG